MHLVGSLLVDERNPQVTRWYHPILIINQGKIFHDSYTQPISSWYRGHLFWETVTCKEKHVSSLLHLLGFENRLPHKPHLSKKTTFKPLHSEVCQPCLARMSHAQTSTAQVLIQVKTAPNSLQLDRTLNLTKQSDFEYWMAPKPCLLGTLGSLFLGAANWFHLLTETKHFWIEPNNGDGRFKKEITNGIALKSWNTNESHLSQGSQNILRLCLFCRAAEYLALHQDKASLRQTFYSSASWLVFLPPPPLTTQIQSSDCRLMRTKFLGQLLKSSKQT